MRGGQASRWQLPRRLGARALTLRAPDRRLARVGLEPRARAGRPPGCARLLQVSRGCQGRCMPPVAPRRPPNLSQARPKVTRPAARKGAAAAARPPRRRPRPVEELPCHVDSASRKWHVEVARVPASEHKAKKGAPGRKEQTLRREARPALGGPQCTAFVCRAPRVGKIPDPQSPRALSRLPSGPQWRYVGRACREQRSGRPHPIAPLTEL